MTVPAAPLPAIGELLRAFAASTDSSDLWARDSWETSVFGQGRTALGAGVDALGNARKAKSTRVWFPDYVCEDALQALRPRPVEFAFYPVRQDLSPNWDRIGEHAHQSVDLEVFVLVHYFGFANDVGAARGFCDRNGMVLVEDCSHMAAPVERAGGGDMMFFSPWKILAVPSGGVLTAPSDFVELPATESSGWISGRSLSWLFVRVTQKLFVRFGVPWHGLTSGAASGSEPCIEHCDGFTLRMLNVTSSHLVRSVERRRRNYRSIGEALSGIDGVRPLFEELREGVCPYVFPIMIDRGSASAVDRLKSAGIPALQWPELPPEIRASPEDHKVALETYDRLLLLPIHQSLRDKDVQLMLRRLGEVVGS